MAKSPWYKEMAVYQIWIRSFCDGNGDGIGDLWGVLSKLDYIKSLGVDAIWFSPIYPSPNADFGYDISDYKNIHPDYGDLELFKQVLAGAHDRGLRVFMDLVVNHSSDEHPWFLESKKGKDNPYHDYYYWRPGKTVRGKRRPPNNWTSLFEGGAWEYDEGLDEYYLHLFARKQPDLNMANPKVREEVKDILRFWLDLGVDGFREDVVTFIAKAEGLPDCYPPLPAANGLKYYSNLPAAKEYLAEFKRDVLARYDCFTVGESPMTTPETALNYVTEGPDQVLDEMIAFSHMEADCIAADVIRRPFNLRKMKKAFTQWQMKLQGKAWNALYIENHDHPRIISRYGSEKYRVESGKMLAAMYILQRGTPFIYQGQEIGMTNMRLPDTALYPDVMTQNNVRLLSKFLPKKQVLKIIQESARDNARTPVQWSAEKNAGFSTGTPWFSVNENYVSVNAAAQEEDPKSLLNFYRSLLRFRKKHEVVLRGDYVELLPESRELYVYERNLNGKKLLVICSFTAAQVRFQAPPGIVLDENALALGNYDVNFVIANGFTTRPYELRVYLFENPAAEEAALADLPLEGKVSPDAHAEENPESGIRNSEENPESEPETDDAPASGNAPSPDDAKTSPVQGEVSERSEDGGVEADSPAPAGKEMPAVGEGLAPPASADVESAPDDTPAPGGPCPSPSGGRCPGAHTGADEGEPSPPDEFAPDDAPNPDDTNSEFRIPNSESSPEEVAP